MIIIKNFGARIEKIWEDMRPVTKKILAGAMQTTNVGAPIAQISKFSYDAHSDWELSLLLSALDEQAKDREVRADAEKLGEIKRLAEICVRVLETKTESAEIFIQLGERLLKQNDYQNFDKLSDALGERFSAVEIAEIIRQTEMPQIRAVAYETLAVLPPNSLLPILEDALYTDIAFAALEQQAFEFENEEARNMLEQFDSDDED